METAISTITLMPMTKAEQVTFIDKVVNEVRNGMIDPVKLAVYLNSITEVIKAIKDNPDVKSIIMEEADKYGKEFNLFGAKIRNSSRTTYDYSGCGDSVYNDLKQQQVKLDEVIKAREAVIKSGVDPVTGETFLPPRTSTSTFLTIKFK